MSDTFSSRQRIAYGCYLLMGLIGVAAFLDEMRLVSLGSDAIIVGSMLAAMLLVVIVPTALILSLILRKDLLLLFLAGFTVGFPLALLVAATISPQNQSIAWLYIVPYVCFLVVASAIRLIQSARQ